MKKLLAILLSLLCIVTLFCGCTDGQKGDKKRQNDTSLNLLGCGFEFGMTKDEINEIGRKASKSDNFDVDNVMYKDYIDRDRIIEGTSKDLLPYKTNYYFDDEDKLYCIDFWLPLLKDNDADIILNNILSIYGKADKYKEINKETEYGVISTFTYKDKNIEVYATYNYSYIADSGTLEFYLIAPGYEMPTK